MTAKFIRVASVDEMANNTSKAVSVEGLELLLCRADGEFFCVENKCSHRDFALTTGRIRRCMLVCPEHGLPFDLRTGKPKGQLTDQPLRMFETRVIDGNVEVRAPSSEA